MEINRRVKKVVFVNTPSDVDGYMNASGGKRELDARHYLFIAMNCSSYSYLRQMGFVVQNTLPYFTNDSHATALERSATLVNWLTENCQFEDSGIGIKQAYKDAFIYYTRCSLIYCMWVIEIVLNAVELHKPEFVVASSRRGPVLSLFIEPEEGYLGSIVRSVAEAKNLKYENISKGANYRGPSAIVRYLQSVIKFAVKYEKFNSWERRVARDSKARGVRPILFTTKFYQMDKLADKLQRELSNRLFCIMKPPAIPYFRVPTLAIKLFLGGYSKKIIIQKRLFGELQKAVKSEREVFSYRDISFSDIISQKIKDNLADYILGLYLWTIRLDSFIDKIGPILVVSNGHRQDDVAFSELCHKKDIPTLLISHGSHIRPKNKYEAIEWGEHTKALLSAPFSYLALQSPLTKEHLEAFPTKNKIIETGPLIWGTAVNPERSRALLKNMVRAAHGDGDIKVIVHAGTPKPSKALRLYVYETPDEYIRSLCDLVDAVRQIPDVILIIKFRPTEEISVESLKSVISFSEKVMLSVKEPFLDILGMADLLVSFSSTTIEEALQNKIPVLLYGGRGRYQHIPAYEVVPNGAVKPSAVYHVKDARNLESSLRGILNLKTRLKGDDSLFGPYIYPENLRTPIVDLLQSMAQLQGEK